MSSDCWLSLALAYADVSLIRDVVLFPLPLGFSWILRAPRMCATGGKGFMDLV